MKGATLNHMSNARIHPQTSKWVQKEPNHKEEMTETFQVTLNTTKRKLPLCLPLLMTSLTPNEE